MFYVSNIIRIIGVFFCWFLKKGNWKRGCVNTCWWRAVLVSNTHLSTSSFGIGSGLETKHISGPVRATHLLQTPPVWAGWTTRPLCYPSGGKHKTQREQEGAHKRQHGVSKPHKPWKQEVKKNTQIWYNDPIWNYSSARLSFWPTPQIKALNKQHSLNFFFSDVTVYKWCNWCGLERS